MDSLIKKLLESEQIRRHTARPELLNWLREVDAPEDFLQYARQIKGGIYESASGQVYRFWSADDMEEFSTFYSNYQFPLQFEDIYRFAELPAEKTVFGIDLNFDSPHFGKILCGAEEPDQNGFGEAYVAESISEFLHLVINSENKDPFHEDHGHVTLDDLPEDDFEIAPGTIFGNWSDQDHTGANSSPSIRQLFAEKNLFERNEQLAQSNSDLSDFVHAASHDLRAPLRAIANLSLWIQENEAERMSIKSQRHLAQLRQRVKRMETLLEGMIEYATIGAAKRSAERIVVSKFFRELQEISPDPNHFKITTHSRVEAVFLPYEPLSRVLRNLVSNAIKHHDKPDGCIELKCYEESEKIIFEVTDDGPGIHPDYHDRIFRMFESLSAKDEVEGSGIGLSLVKRTLEIHGGELQLISNLGQGSTFRTFWPIHAPESEDS